MSQISAPHTQPIPWPSLTRWLLTPLGVESPWDTAAPADAALLLLLAYLVTFDQGAISQAGNYLHELMHDGRHLLGVPCH